MAFKRRYDKYLVLKWEDIDNLLNPYSKETLVHLISVIQAHRDIQGKKENTYVVVNEDEPYAEKVWKLIERGLE